jgi:flagellar basal-body rod modification protein FlgD
MLTPTLPHASAALPVATGMRDQSSGQKIASDFNAFLRMLTVQIQNQDPLEPMAASDFAVQLATFANVEQNTQTNTLLRELLSRTGQAGIDAGADWLGRDLLVSGPHMNDGGPVRLSLPEMINAAAPGEVQALSATGDIVARLPVLPGQGQIVFGPPDSPALPQGTYRYVVAMPDATGQVSTADAAWIARATELRLSLTGTELLLDNGQIIPAQAAQLPQS